MHKPAKSTDKDCWYFVHNIPLRRIQQRLINNNNHLSTLIMLISGINDTFILYKCEQTNTYQHKNV